VLIIQGESNIIRKNIFQKAFLTACSSVTPLSDVDDDEDDDDEDDDDDDDDDDDGGDVDNCSGHKIIAIDGVLDDVSSLSPSSPLPTSPTLTSTTLLSAAQFLSNMTWFINVSLLPHQLGMLNYNMDFIYHRYNEIYSIY